MHIRKTEAGTFEARYRDPSGRQRQRTFKTKFEAKDFLARTSADMQRSEWNDPALARQTFDQFVSSWWPTKVALRPSTRALYAGLLRRYLLPEFGSARIGAISPLDVRTFVARLSAAGVGPAKTGQCYRLLATIMRAAQESRVIGRTPCTGIDLPPSPTNEMRFLSAQEVNRLAAAIDPRYRALVLVAAYTGARWGELAGLRRSKLNLLRGLWRYRKPW